MNGQWVVTINGAGLVDGAQVRWNGLDLPTTFGDDSRVNATLSEAQLNSGGVLRVVNPAPGGGASNELPLLPRQNQSIAFAPLPNRVLGEAPFIVTASANSALPVSLASATPTICTLSEIESGWTITLVAVGECRLVATQAGDALFQPAPSVEQSFIVSAQPLRNVYLPLIQK